MKLSREANRIFDIKMVVLGLGSVTCLLTIASCEAPQFPGNGQQPSVQSGPGQAIRREGIDAAAGTLLQGLLSGGRPNWGQIGAEAAAIIVVSEIRATDADIRYAEQQAKQYQRKTKAQTLAVQTKQKSKNGKPTAILVNRKTGKAIGDKKYEINEAPKEGDIIYISSYDAEYVR